MDKEKTIFSKRIRELRNQKKATQSDVAKAIGVTQGAYSKWERSELEPDLKNLTNLAIYFDVSLDYLMGIIDTYNPVYPTKEEQLVVKPEKRAEIYKNAVSSFMRIIEASKAIGLDQKEIDKIILKNITNQIENDD